MSRRSPTFERARALLLLSVVAPLLGQPLSAQATARVSVGAGAVEANFGSELSSISRRGSHVVFTSAATNLVAGDGNATLDVFLRDLGTGSVVMVSVDPAGAPGNGASYAPVVSADGRYVAFSSDATNLVPFDINAAADVFLRDVLVGATTLVSHAIATPASGNAGSAQQGITPDGRFVAFYSSASDLIGFDPNSRADAFVFDRTTGLVELASPSSTGGAGNSDTYDPTTWHGPCLSDDGRYVAFTSFASNLTPGDTNSNYDVFVRDRQLGTTARASVNAAGVQGNLESRGASVSADGRWVAFGSGANNLVPADTGPYDYFVKDLRTGEVDRVDVATGGGQGAGGGFMLVPTSSPFISADGRFVAFGHKFTNLVPGDVNGSFDSFRHDRWLVRTELLSVSTGGVQANSTSNNISMSEDGSRALFESFATNLVAGDTNVAGDVFLRTTPVPHVSYCFGDGTPGSTPCPCANAGAFHHGCENTTGRGGAVLFAEGDPRGAADTITLHAARVRPNALTVFRQGTAREGGGAGSPFDDGLQCLAGTQVMIAARRSSPAGLTSFGAGVPGDPPVSLRGGLPAAGGTRFYQVQYRDPAAFCSPSTTNRTNGIEIVWSP